MAEPINNDTYPERRIKHRIICDNPAVVKDRLTQGKDFSDTGRVLNLSSAGMFVVANQEIQKDTEVIVRIAIPSGSLKWGTSKLNTVGNVVRDEIQSDGKVGLAIKFQGFKFM